MTYEEWLAIEIEVHEEVVLLRAAVDKVDDREEHCAHCGEGQLGR